jgi:hypothetical protein
MPRSPAPAARRLRQRCAKARERPLPARDDRIPDASAPRCAGMPRSRAPAARRLRQRCASTRERPVPAGDDLLADPALRVVRGCPGHRCRRRAPGASAPPREGSSSSRGSALPGGPAALVLPGQIEGKRRGGCRPAARQGILRLQQPLSVRRIPGGVISFTGKIDPGSQSTREGVRDRVPPGVRRPESQPAPSGSDPMRKAGGSCCGTKRTDRSRSRSDRSRSHSNRLRSQKLSAVVDHAVAISVHAEEGVIFARSGPGGPLGCSVCVEIEVDGGIGS